ncbi:MAG: spore coat protein [Oscillospiraceae bacterium]|nr:spore coat protein [Oscillospiraceae bacterium]
MQKKLQDQEILADILASQKQAAAEFNQSAGECACPKLKRDMMKIHAEEQSGQSQVFTAMHERGWYPTVAAEPQKVQQARVKFEGIAQQLG